MKLTHLSHNHFRVSDADAAKLARASGHSLPRIGYEAEVPLPNGKKAWLKRDYASTPSPNKRGWVWAISSNARIVSDDERVKPYVRWGQVYEV
jgi:hypothetical protein